jgi:hypothetical protein
MLIETSRSFNRKERFYLVGKALGNENFQLSKAFRDQLGSAIGVSVPSSAFCAMDYHLDWLYAALYLQSHDSQSTIVEDSSGNITGNQQICVFLVSFERNTITHLVLLEAKGATSWSNEQMRCKTERLRGIFVEDGNRFQDVKPHFLLTSPRRPKNLKEELWPLWMRRGDDTNWFELDKWPKNPVKVTLVDPPNQLSKYWKVEPVP